MAQSSMSDFRKAVEVGRPPNVVKLFPHSQALIVSGKVIDRAMLAKGKAMTIAANGLNGIAFPGRLELIDGHPEAVGRGGRDHHRRAAGSFSEETGIPRIGHPQGGCP